MILAPGQMRYKDGGGGGRRYDFIVFLLYTRDFFSW